MGLQLSQIFLRNFDLLGLLRKVGPAWRRIIAADRENARRQILLLLSPPWGVLVDSTGQLPQELALTLSGEAGGQATWIQVNGNTLSYELFRAVEGETVARRRVPKAEEGDRMPWYVDAEQEAWNALARLGVPPPYRLLRPEDLDPDDPAAGDADMVVVERPALDQPLQHASLKHAIRNPRSHEQGPPSEYCRFHEPTRRLYDEYLLQGELEEDRVDHLLNVLDQIARRKERPPQCEYQPILIAGGGERENEKARTFVKERYDALSRFRTFAYRL